MATLLGSIFRSSIWDRDEPAPSSPKPEDKEFLAGAMERFKLSEQGEADIRRKALDDYQFLIGEQWDPDVREARRRDARPCLTMNRLRQFRRMVTNEQRQQRPAIQVNPVGDESDVATAEVLQGLCRHVEVNSDAEIAYDSAFECMATGGFGYWRIITDYVDEDSDEQDIYIKRIKNPFAVYFDPRAVEPDYSDAMFAFIIDDMQVEVYREEYPDSSLASIVQYTSVGDATPGWITKTTVRVAEYFYVELETRKKGRPKRTVKWAKINAIERLDERDVPCRYIPIVPVLGDDTVVNGKRDLVGMIRDAKDPQKFYNFHISAAAEMIALAPRSPFIVAEGQIEGHEPEWEQANRRSLATLTFKPVSSTNGTPFGPPQRNAAEPPIQAMVAMIRQADNDLKSTTGIYDASLGQQGPEQSGKAVLLRQKQSDIANLNYTDNQARAIRHTGRILIDMFPRVYTESKVRRIIKPDGAVEQVGVFNSAQGGDAADEEMAAVAKIFDIGAGRYDVSVSVGPSYQSKRQEAVASQVALISAYPQIMPIAGDLLVRNMDWPGAEQIADRLKLRLPPQLHDVTSGDPANQIQQMQAAIQQLQAQNQQLVGALQHSQNVISQKMIEGQSKENVALIDNWTKLNVARISASKDRDTAQADQEIQMLMGAHDSAHEAGMQALDQAHERGMAQTGAANDMAQQQQAQQMQQPPPGANPQPQPGAPPAAAPPAPA